MKSKRMKRLISIIVAISLFVSLVLPVSAKEVKHNVNQNVTEFTFTSQDGVTYTASIVEHGKGSLTTTVSGSNGYYEVTKATRINEEAVLIESGGKTVEYNLPSINTDSISTEELVTIASSYVKKGTIYYDTPIGLSGYPAIDFLYNNYSTSSGIVSLNEIEGQTISFAITLISAVLGTAAGGYVWGIISGVVAFVSGNYVVKVTVDTISAVWWDYEVKGRKDGVLSNPIFGTTYSARDPYGNEIGRIHHGITPEIWTSANSATTLFSQFYSLVIYNGVLYFDWA